MRASHWGSQKVFVAIRATQDGKSHVQIWTVLDFPFFRIRKLASLQRMCKVRIFQDSIELSRDIWRVSNVELRQHLAQ